MENQKKTQLNRNHARPDGEAVVPLFWTVGERICLVVGGGRVACRKVQWLLDCGARVQVVAPDIAPSLRAMQAEEPGRLSICQEVYDGGKWRLAEFALVLMACGEDAVNRQIHRETRAAGVPLNVADVPELCDFHVPATIHRGTLRIAIGSGGRCPGLAGYLRRTLERQVPAWYGELAEGLGKVRDWLRAQENIAPKQRQEIMKRLVAEDFIDSIRMDCENMEFLKARPRRLRKNEAIRRLTRETRLSPEQLILPLFVKLGDGQPETVESMPGVFRWSVDDAVEQARQALALGIRGILLFGIAEDKDDEGSFAWNEAGATPQAVRAIKEAVPDLCVFTDVCLCGYTAHGHCGVVRDGTIDNDATLRRLARVALCHARAGADFVAPSDMMDGRVGYLRAALDREGFQDTGILSYAVKYASAFYGPFREAAASAPAFGDRKTHQMDTANAREAVREAVLDENEGADMLMIKPGLPCLDIVHRVREKVSLPVAVYSVSGEYSMLKSAVASGWLNERAAVLESLTAMARAGADMVVTYYALEAAAWLREA